ncbi:hypothetical protein POM88_013307 [Heracleum sosnowskyi]|uniref:Retrotransposon gag domain-containing protein n=1 Tax=Heracleum sosnowskyi TaxID=360622 RepID=A0AAD8IYZ3_9APIA|nr:hypothetical protein POM88_013307 [Heracleum sosnowskyi]
MQQSPPRGRIPQRHNEKRTPPRERIHDTRDGLTAEQLAEQNARFQKQLDQLHKKVDGDPDFEIIESPFTLRLEAQPRDKKAKHPQLRFYNGDKNPGDHTQFFDQQMALHDYNDLTKYRLFASTLEGHAQKLFSLLTPRSIDTWMEFRASFLRRFRANHPHDIHTVSLEGIVQKKGKSLDDYIFHFKKGVNRVTFVDQGEAISAFKQGLDSYEYKDYVLDLIRKDPKDLAKVYAMASEYITGDNALRAMRLIDKNIGWISRMLNRQKLSKKRKKEGRKESLKLKTRTNKDAKGKWAEELPNVLWSYRTTLRTSTGESLFKLCYGTEAVLPIEMGSPSFRIVNYNGQTNSEGLRTNLDLLDEVRDKVVLRMTNYKQKTAAYFGKKIKQHQYSKGDLVLRATEVSDPGHQGKLSPNWEGPYIVTQVIRPGTYKLSTMDGAEIANTWHGLRLCKFYI